MRRAAKRDASEASIVEYLRKAGWTWEPHSSKDGPDGFASIAGITVAVENKTGKAKQRPGQKQWAERWQGMYFVLRTIEDAAALHRAVQPLRRFKEQAKA